ncbi:MAG: PilZ domain-containing protein [Deltaproteobacteria bacterium]|nr:PilZ domain-containing protein [Deltaproteobacteria bacterium]
MSIPVEITGHGTGSGFGRIEALSAAGCRVRYPAALPIGAVLHLKTHLTALPRLDVAARVVSRGPTIGYCGFVSGLRFEPQTRSVHAAVRALVSMVERRSSARQHPGVLVLTDDREDVHELARGIARLGWQPIMVNTPLDVVIALGDVTTRIDAAVFVTDCPGTGVVDLGAFLLAERPQVRRLLLSRRPLSPCLQDTLRGPTVDAVLVHPVQEAELLRALLSSLANRSAAGRTTA